jgi:rhamnulokinase
MSTYVAVDLGASSGRVFAASVVDERLVLDEVHRFANVPVQQENGLHWDISELYREVLLGISNAAERYRDIVSIGIDSWAVDYGLLDEHRALIEDPFHYRDSRTDGIAQRTYEALSVYDQYTANGLQYLAFNTLFQLEAARGSSALERAKTLLMIPDLLAFWLTGVARTEHTNASTTGLLDVTTRNWSSVLSGAIGLDSGLLTPMVAPGTVLGRILPEIAARTGLDPTVVVTTVGSHDTASAVVGVPACDHRFAYISCGTWGLVGVEIDAPILTDESRSANFTNEGGVDGTVRFLRNVTGLWLLQESLRIWANDDPTLDLAVLIHEASKLPGDGPTFDVTDATLLAPGDIPARIGELLHRSGESIPVGRGAFVRCILDSLASAFAEAVADAGRLAAHPVDVVHIVGGGSQNELLCQLTANRCGLPVMAGPAEATVVGNALVQLRTHRELVGDLTDLRSFLRRSILLATFIPEDWSSPSAI